MNSRSVSLVPKSKKQQMVATQGTIRAINLTRKMMLSLPLKNERRLLTIAVYVASPNKNMTVLSGETFNATLEP